MSTHPEAGERKPVTTLLAGLSGFTAPATLLESRRPARYLTVSFPLYPALAAAHTAVAFTVAMNR